jgi:hypothetical protein
MKKGRRPRRYAAGAIAALRSKIALGSTLVRRGARAMKTIARRLLAPLVATLLFAGAAAAQTPSLASRLVGHWSLASVAIGDQKPYGADPKGSMFFDASGHYAVIVAGAGGAGAIAYFGEYTLDETAGVLSLHVDAGNRGGAAGRDERRLVQLDGDALTLRSAHASQGLGGVTLVWQRAD